MVVHAHPHADHAACAAAPKARDRLAPPLIIHIKVELEGPATSASPVSHGCLRAARGAAAHSTVHHAVRHRLEEWQAPELAHGGAEFARGHLPRAERAAELREPRVISLVGRQAQDGGGEVVPRHVLALERLHELRHAGGGRLHGWFLMRVPSIV